ncbi:MAG TPA: right-handed parallel beta-helix repeat-containing protein, partial [Candidatus Binataceae bacterium]|nr:right-handed parallel beta-helix repeat-containing protein [Candidatus Binataceae bacterium]
MKIVHSISYATRGSVSMLAASATLLAVLAAAPAPADASPACASQIKKCGCTVISTGIYTVTKDLDANQGLTSRNDCIDVTAPNVILKLKGHPVNGPATGVGTGIWLSSAATSSIVEGADNSGAAPEPPTLGALQFSAPPLALAGKMPLFGQVQASGPASLLSEESVMLPVQDPWTPLAGAQPTINGWQYGIEDDADFSTVELFKQIGGNLFLQHGNSIAGVFVNGASNVTLDDMIVGFNGKNGINIQNGGSNRLFDVTVDHNGTDGVAIQSSNVNTIANITADHNKGHGIAVYSSDNDQLFTFGAFKNDLDGVFVGVNPDLPLAGPGLGNHLSNGSARDNGDYGVELDDTTAGNTVNQLTETGANN